jgi:hypothetical protein
LRWVAEIAGVKREWYAEILEQRVDAKVAWAATEGATNAGAVYFTPTGATQTLVRLELEYEPEGMVEKVGDALHIIERQATSDLEKFKEFIESKGAESGAWRADVPGTAVGTPGVADATSHGDSGKAGISGKAAAAGVAAAAAGVAAAAAATSGSKGDDSPEEVVEVAPAPPVEVETTTVVETDVEPAVEPRVDDTLGRDPQYPPTPGPADGTDDVPPGRI